MLGLFELLPAYSVVNTGSIYSLQSISGDIHDYTFFWVLFPESFPPWKDSLRRRLYHLPLVFEKGWIDYLLSLQVMFPLYGSLKDLRRFHIYSARGSIGFTLWSLFRMPIIWRRSTIQRLLVFFCATNPSRSWHWPKPPYISIVVYTEKAYLVFNYLPCSSISRRTRAKNEQTVS